MMDERIVDQYQPIEGGWRLRLSGDPAAPRRAPGAEIGVVGDLPGSTGHESNPEMERRRPTDDARLHRRPLFPPADRRLLFSDEELAHLERMSFRPLVLAWNGPRFVLDLHLAGGLMGHLRLGYAPSTGAGRWLEDWREVEVRYVDGRMTYDLTDPDFPGVMAKLEVAALAGSVGLIQRYHLEGNPPDGSLVWCYGGATAFFTGYNFGTPHFRLAAGQADRDQVGWNQGIGWLRRAFGEGDAVLEQGSAAPRLLPGWTALVEGGSSAPGEAGFATAEAAAGSDPAVLLQATEMSPAGGRDHRQARVLVQRLQLSASPTSGFIVLGAGHQMQTAIRDPEAAWIAALARNQGIAGRVTTRTPDPHLDAAVGMMAFATEGTWGDLAYLHGGWSWRNAYLGWRTWYGPSCYGWTDRVRGSIERHLALNRVTAGEDCGALGAILEYPPGVYYNMNEVFLDHVRQYLDYTADLELMRRILPLLRQILVWEDRRLQPGNADLYESSLNTWISDSHWAIRGQCSQASAYMLRGHELLADLSFRLGEPAEGYRERAERIRAAMQRHLWQPRAGIFAEYRDTLGHRLLHPEPELPTLYHTAEFGAASPLQVWEMLHWADTHLSQVETPGGGRFYWSSNWHPNQGRSYTHSTYEMAYGEELNLALTNWQAGRAAEGYALLRGTLCGIYNGPTPGGLACHAYVDGRQRGNDEFADASSMWGRAVVEGLFGIRPQRPDRAVDLCPQFPAAWSEAAIHTSHFSFTWQRHPGGERIAWEAAAETSVRLRLAVHAASLGQVTVNGQPVSPVIEPGVGLTWVLVETGAARAGTIEVEYAPLDASLPAPRTVSAGSRFTLDLTALGATELLNPQSVLRDLSIENGRLEATVDDEPGPGLVFLLAGTAACPRWVPLSLRVVDESAAPVTWSPPAVPRDLQAWTLVDLGPVYNARFTEVLPRVMAAAMPPALPASQVNFGYRNDHISARLLQPPSDAAWRGKVDDDGVAWTADGIPFRSCREGENIAVVTRTGGFPPSLRFPVAATGRALYLMLSGITFPAQSHVPNLRVVLGYDDGERETVELVSPFGIGDCWGTALGRFHDTQANGFENLGGRFGPAGSREVDDLSRPVAVDTEAHLVAFPLRPGRLLLHVELEAVAEDVVFGVMGASVLR